MNRVEALQIITDRKRAYQALLAVDTPAAKAVLDDLTIFCRGKETCLIPGDHDRTYAALGRNEVFHRIMDHLEKTPEQLLEIYTRPAKGAHGHDDDTDPPA